jgi:hypothetical protein
VRMSGDLHRSSRDRRRACLWACPLRKLAVGCPRSHQEEPHRRLVYLARLGRLELPAYRFEVCRSIQLSYRRAP